MSGYDEGRVDYSVQSAVTSVRSQRSSDAYAKEKKLFVDFILNFRTAENNETLYRYALY